MCFCLTFASNPSPNPIRTSTWISYVTIVNWPIIKIPDIPHFYMPSGHEIPIHPATAEVQAGDVLKQKEKNRR